MKTELFEYLNGTATLEAYIARPETDEPRPTVLIAHAWAGRDQFACNKADEMAKLGYVGFALDMFGKGKLGTSTEENAGLIGPFMEDREYLKRRVMLAYETANALPYVDSDKIAAIGFCFGGMCVLDLARSDAPISGVVSFHGLLDPPPVTDDINAKILALHGDLDPMVSHDKVRAFQKEMTKAGADWQMQIYGKTYHAFTNPEANNPALGTIYNVEADKRSWVAMKNFFEEIF